MNSRVDGEPRSPVSRVSSSCAATHGLVEEGPGDLGQVGEKVHPLVGNWAGAWSRELQVPQSVPRTSQDSSPTGSLSSVLIGGRENSLFHGSST